MARLSYNPDRFYDLRRLLLLVESHDITAGDLADELREADPDVGIVEKVGDGLFFALRDLLEVQVEQDDTEGTDHA